MKSRYKTAIMMITFPNVNRVFFLDFGTAAAYIDGIVTAAKPATMHKIRSIIIFVINTVKKPCSGF